MSTIISVAQMHRLVVIEGVNVLCTCLYCCQLYIFSLVELQQPTVNIVFLVGRPRIAFARFYTSNRGCRPSSSGTVPMEANSSANLLVIEGVNALYISGLLSYEKETKQKIE